MQVLSITILGEPASKANSRKLVQFHGMSRLIKSTKALNYSEAFKRQCDLLLDKNAELIEGDVKVCMKIYYATRRPDLDESLILDLLQGYAYANDRQVKEKHIIWGLDKENPRAEITVEKKAPEQSGLSGAKKEKELRA